MLHEIGQFAETYPTEISIALGGLTAATLAVNHRLSQWERSQKIIAVNRFEVPGDRAELQDYTEQAVEYADSEQVGAVVLIDGAARPFYKPFIDAWNQTHDPVTEPRPPIYFLNPQGFRSQELDTGIFKIKPMVTALRKGTRVERPGKRRSVMDIGKSFIEHYPGLMDKRQEPLMVVDGCVHTGLSTAHMFTVLKALGFNDVRLVVSYRDPSIDINWLAVKPSLVMSEVKPRGMCYPFGIDSMTSKTYASCYSAVNKRRRDREIAVKLRQSLKGLMEVDPETGQSE